MYHFSKKIHKHLYLLDPQNKTFSVTEFIKTVKEVLNDFFDLSQIELLTNKKLKSEA